MVVHLMKFDFKKLGILHICTGHTLGLFYCIPGHKDIADWQKMTPWR